MFMRDKVEKWDPVVGTGTLGTPSTFGARGTLRPRWHFRSLGISPLTCERLNQPRNTQKV